jgi:hypothetical protein
MDKMLLVSGEIAAVAASIFASYAALLFYRAPNHAKWLESNAATTTVMIALMTAIIFSVAFLVQGLVAVLVDPLAAIAVAIGIFIVLAWGVWKLLRMPARLKAAEEGRSLFRPGDNRPPAPKARRGRGPRAA